METLGVMFSTDQRPCNCPTLTPWLAEMSLLWAHLMGLGMFYLLISFPHELISVFQCLAAEGWIHTWYLLILLFSSGRMRVLSDQLTWTRCLQTSVIGIRSKSASPVVSPGIPDPRPGVTQIASLGENYLPFVLRQGPNVCMLLTHAHGVGKMGGW